MARSNIPMVINLRQNTNDDSTAFGKWFAEVDAKEPLNLKGLAKHMTEHGKISSEEMCNLVLGEMVKCLMVRATARTTSRRPWPVVPTR